MKRLPGFGLSVCVAMSAVMFAQSEAAGPIGQKSSVVPNFVKISGTAKDVGGKPITGVVGVTLALYQEEAGGAALWMETQKVHADAAGHYNVSLGPRSCSPSKCSLLAKRVGWPYKS
jgi:hypothetical protein